MKLIIDIPEVVKHKVYAHGLSLCPSDKEQLIHAIMNGTPLPKGHGRLVDADSMKTMKNIQSANFNAVALIRLWIDNQPTIIEADKAESEDKE